MEVSGAIWDAVLYAMLQVALFPSKDANLSHAQYWNIA